MFSDPPAGNSGEKPGMGPERAGEGRRKYLRKSVFFVVCVFFCLSFGPSCLLSLCVFLPPFYTYKFCLFVLFLGLCPGSSPGPSALHKYKLSRGVPGACPGVSRGGPRDRVLGCPGLCPKWAAAPWHTGAKSKSKKKKSSMLRTATFCQLSHRFHLVNSSIFVTHVFRLPPTVFARGCHSNDWVEGWQCSPPVSNDDTAQSALGSWRTLALQDARKSKERTYPELLRSRRCRLVVLAIETGGRWSPEATTFLRLLAQTKARAVPNIVRKAGGC